MAKVRKGTGAKATGMRSSDATANTDASISTNPALSIVDDPTDSDKQQPSSDAAPASEVGDPVLRMIDGGASSLYDLETGIRAACAADALIVAKAKSDHAEIAEQIKSGYLSTGIAGQAILAGVICLNAIPIETVQEYIGTLTVVNAKGEERKLKYNKRAGENIAVPLALYGYSGTGISSSHVSKVSTTVGYAHALNVAPEDFPTFLTGEHSHSKGKGFGLAHAYSAAREFFSPVTETAEQKAAKRRLSALERIKSEALIATINRPTGANPSVDGLYCLIARTNATSGAVEVVMPVQNYEGKLINRLLDILAEQLATKDQEAKGKASVEAAPKPMSDTVANILAKFKAEKAAKIAAAQQ